MVFEQWYALPKVERKHRLLLYLSDVETQIERNDEATPWEDDPDWAEG